MSSTRRNFIGGAIALAIGRPLLAKVNAVLPTPRTWDALRYQEIPEMGGTALIGCWQALRSDSVYFFISERLWLEDCWLPDQSAYRLDVKNRTRILLNGFLDSACDCSIKRWCALHSHLRPAMIDMNTEDDVL
jgi:hypothetical protein